MRDGAHVSLTACFASLSTTRHGLDARGASTDVKVSKCEFMDNMESNAVVCQGAGVSFESCTMRGARRFNGMTVVDKGSEV